MAIDAHHKNNQNSSTVQLFDCGNKARLLFFLLHLPASNLIWDLLIKAPQQPDYHRCFLFYACPLFAS